MRSASRSEPAVANGSGSDRAWVTGGWSSGASAAHAGSARPMARHAMCRSDMSGPLPPLSNGCAAHVGPTVNLAQVDVVDVPIVHEVELESVRHGVREGGDEWVARLVRQVAAEERIGDEQVCRRADRIGDDEVHHAW